MSKIRLAIIPLLIFLVLPNLSVAAAAMVDDVLILSGDIINTHGKGVSDVAITLVIAGERSIVKKQFHTDGEGHFAAEISVPAGLLPAAQMQLKARKFSYAPSTLSTLKPLKSEFRADENAVYLVHANLTLRRTLSPALWISAAVLLMIYILIGFDLLHRTLSAMLGTTLLLGITYLVGPFFPDFKIISACPKKA